MSIEVECDGCAKMYRVPDERAGETIRCRGCGASVDIPEPRRAGAGRRKRKGGDTQMLKLLIGGGVGLLGLAAVVYVGMMAFSRGGAKPDVDSNQLVSEQSSAATTTGDTATTSAAPTVTEEEKAANKVAYDARVQQERAKQADTKRDDLAKQHGADKVVTVVITNVPGDPLLANKYLESKVFRASFHDYKEASKKAGDATEANRKKAEQDATANSSGFGMVHYWYKPVHSDLPYPQVFSAASGEGTFTYHAFPVLNLEQFASRMGLGTTTKVDGGKRIIQIKAELPDPVPDPEVEDLVVQFGKDSVATVTVTGAVGDVDRVLYFLESKTATCDPDKTLSVVALQQLGSGKYKFSVAPVNNISLLGEKLTYGKVDSFDDEARTLTLTASLPTDLPPRPTAAELAELRRKEWDKPSPMDTAPKDGEDFYVWVKRVIKGNVPWAAKAALTQLQHHDVEEDKLKEISALLISTLKDSSAIPEHLAAMIVWRTPETDKAILAQGGNKTFTFHNQKAMTETLGKLGTKEAAAALASGLDDFFAGEDVTTALAEFGPLAEDSVMKFASHKDEKVRRRVYTILEAIGTKKCLAKLKGNITKERDDQMKDLAQIAYDTVKARVDEAGEGDPQKKDSPDDSPFKSAPP